MTQPRTCIVTGAASGIGRHLAQRLLSRGWRVTATDIDAEGLATLTDDAMWSDKRGRTMLLDVRDAPRWRDVVADVEDAWGQLDALFNVAGFIVPGYAHETSDDDVDRHIDINLKGVIHGTRVAASHMVERGEGLIVNIGSLASLAPVAGLPLYTASKFGVRGFSLAAAQELRDKGVDVSVVLPDAVATPMLDLQVDYEEAAMTFSGSEPLTVEQVVDVLVDRVIPRRPMEVSVPASRGGLARLSTVWPQVSFWLSPLLAKIGAKNQSAYRTPDDD